MIRNFFLADDDRDDTDLFGEALKKIDNGIILHTAANGKELMESLRTLKNNENLREIPVVMYSTSAAFLDGNRAIKSGAICYLEKPFSFSKLKEFLQELTMSSSDELIDTLKSIEASKKHNLIVALSGFIF